MVPVATLAKVFTPLKYGMLPMTASLEVERPPNDMALVARVRGKLNVRAFSYVLVSVYKRPAEVDRIMPEVVVEIEIAPVEPMIERIEVVVVEVPSIVVVAKYKFPPAFRKVH